MPAWVTLRRVSRRHAVVTASVGMLGLGLTALVTIRTIFGSMLLGPVPGVSDPDRVVTVSFRDASAGGSLSISRDDLGLVGPGVPALQRVAGIVTINASLVTSESGISANAGIGLVSPGYFDVLGVRPRIGRLLAADGGESADGDAAVISDRLWQRLFAGDVGVIGKRLVIGSRSYTVVGVAADFRGQARLWHTDVWVPLISGMPVMGVSQGPSLLVGRLRNGQRSDAVATQISVLVARFDRTRWLSTTQPRAVVSRGVVPTNENRSAVQLATIYRILSWGGLLLLVLASANVASLLIASNISRQDTLALCVALGASRSRLLLASLSEAVTVAMAATGLALLAGGSLAHAFAGTSILPGLDTLDDLAIGWRATVLAMLAACAATAVAVFLPNAVFAIAARPIGTRRAHMTAATLGRTATNAMVAVQVAVAFALLAITGVLARTVINLRSVPVGFAVGGVMALTLEPSSSGYDSARRRIVYHDLIDRMQESPYVDGAAQAEWLLGKGPLAQISLPDGTKISAEYKVISEDFFLVLGIPLKAGRTFNHEDVVRGPDAPGQGVILSQQLAEQISGPAAPVGRHVFISDRPRIAEGRLVAVPREVTIVGIVGDARFDDVRQGSVSTVYEPGYSDRGSVIVRLRGAQEDAGTVLSTLAELRRTAHDVAPAVPVGTSERLSDVMDRRLAQDILLFRASVALAFVAAILASMGILSVSIFLVTRRHREIAVRMALGGSLRGVTQAVLAGPLVSCALGTLGGEILFLVSSRLLTSRVFGISVLDGPTQAIAAAVLFALVSVSMALPTRRIARVDPIEPLRSE